MERLVRINAKGINLEGVSGGRSSFTTADLSACLAGCDKAGLNLLFKRIAGHRIPVMTIYKQTIDRAMRTAWKNGWNLTDKGQKQIKILLWLAICEKTATNVCPSCRGTKYSLLRPSEACRTCRGTGKWKIDDYIKARAIGINKSSYSRTWRERFDDLILMLETREYIAEKSIYKMLD